MTQEKLISRLPPPICLSVEPDLHQLSSRGQEEKERASEAGGTYDVLVREGARGGAQMHPTEFTK